jgi:hypothetical protein
LASLQMNQVLCLKHTVYIFISLLMNGRLADGFRANKCGDNLLNEWTSLRDELHEIVNLIKANGIPFKQ